MGCGPSRKNVAVHPEQATDQTGDLLPAADTPDVPAGSLEATESSDQDRLLERVSKQLHDLSGSGQLECHPFPLISRTPPSNNATPPTSTSPSESANDHSGAVLLAQGEGLRYVIRSPLSTDELPPVEAWVQDYTKAKVSSEMRVTLYTMGEDHRMSPLSVDPDPFAALPSHSAPHPPERLVNRLRPACGTDSQIEFFKMLDKKIEEGPEYVSEDSSSS